MKNQHLGIILFVVGLGLLFWGYRISESLGGRLSSAITGSPGDNAMWYYIIGAACAALGLFNLMKK